MSARPPGTGDEADEEAEGESAEAVCVCLARGARGAVPGGVPGWSIRRLEPVWLAAPEGARQQKTPLSRGSCGLDCAWSDNLLVEAEGIEPSSENALRAASTGLEQVQFSSSH